MEHTKAFVPSAQYFMLLPTAALRTSDRVLVKQTRTEKNECTHFHAGHRGSLAGLMSMKVIFRADIGLVVAILHYPARQERLSGSF